jgi:hypothetical protein
MTLRERWFFYAALTVLVSSTIVWAWVSAWLQRGNSDQLVDGFLFQDYQTFHLASFPVSHTQFMKWPLFILLHMAHYSQLMFVVMTVLITVSTTLGFGFVLFRIARRNTWTAGLVCLLFATTLVTIPTYAYGVTTPLNMALLTGRNIEYVVYIASLFLLIRMPRFRSRQFGAAMVLLTLLMASDQLFLYYSIPSALALFAFGWFGTQQTVKRIAWQWLLTTCIAGALSFICLALIGHYLTHIVNSPLGFSRVSTPFELWLGIIGTVRAEALNFGLTNRAGWLMVPALCLAALVIGGVCWAIYRFGRRIAERQVVSDNAELLSMMLLLSTITAVVIFAGTSQPYLSDARYLSISLFAAFTVLATELRHVTIRVPHRYWATLGSLMTLAIILGLIADIQSTVTQHASGTIGQRNSSIARLLKTYHVEYLVGDYWRVFPIRMLSPQATQAVLPLESCTGPITVLTSTAWQPDLRFHSFAYLLNIRPPQGIPELPCQQRFIAAQYGIPSSVVVINGSTKNPTEELLFYNSGASDRLLIRPSTGLPLEIPKHPTTVQ